MSPTDNVLQFFDYTHLTAGRLRETSKKFHDLAHALAETTTASAELIVALRKLLESKDSAVRATLIDTPADQQAPRISDEEI